MSEPIYDASTERYYSRLSEFFRSADVANDWTLKRWLSGITGELGAMDTMIDRFLYVTPDAGGAPGDTSDLVDPATADVAWLPWLAQLVGAVIPATLSVADQRAAISNQLRDLQHQPGSKGAMANAAKARLTGTRSSNIYDHSKDTGTPGAAGPWDVLIVTIGTETPGGVDPRDDVIAANAKPAGVKLYWRTFESVWAAIESGLATWAQWEAAGSWRAIEESGL